MDSLRLKFSKTGRAIYISHLDLMRTMQRAFLRAGLPLKYSEGFNPHALIAIALPLSVGASSLCELLDFRLNGFMSISEIPFRLNKALPEGIQALEVYESENKFKNIKWLDIEGFFEYDGRSPDNMLPCLMDFFARDSIVIQKKTKSGIAPSDIAPGIRSIAFDIGNACVNLKAVISAQEPTLNPDLLSSALAQLAPELKPDFASFRRTQVYDSEMNVFR
ncbi:MAG: TIGR03936 family radical SAM-associated protein [Oscillospiraceae bacterium]|nr:TIGR03936 family radical SAM-associated protein [Oscillospiraceae bacterium]